MTDEAAIRERDVAFMAETPGGPEWTSRQRGEALFQAGMDRHYLLALLDAERAETARLRETHQGDMAALQALRTDADRLYEGLVAWYPKDGVAVARLCDDYLDRSGRLLGRIRADARAALNPERSNP